VMGAAALVSRVFGSVRVLVIAAVLGTTYLGNAFQASNSVSNVLFELLAAGALSAVLVPTFIGFVDRGDRAGAEALSGSLLGVALAAMAVVSVVGVLTAPWIARLIVTAVPDERIAAEQQDLVTFLLRWFVPQVMLYAVGAVTTAVLHSRRRFVAAAVAPIGNTVVMVGFLAAFAWSAGPNPGLQLASVDRWLLAMAGTLGVVAFVAIPYVALARTGFRLRPRMGWGHQAVRHLVGLSGWATLQYAGFASLNGAAILAGGSVPGGVVAFGVGWFFFLAPFGVVGQPIATAILPELVEALRHNDHAKFAQRVRWAADRITVLLAPITALACGLAVPAMSVAAFGQASGDAGVSVLAAALGSLCVGLVPYALFHLYARAWFALDDSRTPAVVGAVGAIVGVVGMAVAPIVADGAGTVVVLGLAHTAAFVVGAAVLAARLRRRVAFAILPTGLWRTAAVTAIVATLAWVGARAWNPGDRVASLAAVLVLGVLAAGTHLGVSQLVGAGVLDQIRRRGELT